MLSEETYYHPCVTHIPTSVYLILSTNILSFKFVSFLALYFFVHVIILYKNFMSPACNVLTTPLVYIHISVPYIRTDSIVSKSLLILKVL
jgi:hypothetical protein